MKFEDISDIVISSDRVKKGDIFFSDLKAEKFIDSNLIEKAKKIYVNEGFSKRSGLKDDKIIEIKDFRNNLVLALQNRYKFNLKLIAITGTKGKTSSCWHVFNLIRKLNKENKKVGYFGSLGFFIGDFNSYVKIKSLNLTTPAIDDIYRILEECNNKNCNYVVFEASSHALDQGRIDGLDISIASFTNLSQDHLDYFKDVNDTFEAKKLLFSKYLNKNGYCVLNSDISEYKPLIKICKEKEFFISSYGKNAEDFKLIEIKTDSILKKVKFKFKNIEYSFEVKIFGDFQIYNMLNAFSICFGLGFDINDIINNAKYITSPVGRLELIDVFSKTNKRIFVDHSHTPYSLFSSIESLNQIKGNAKLFTIFGCGGDRDKIKRPVMGYISVKFSDFSIITSDNPRFENKDEIINDILQGVNCNFENIKNFNFKLSLEELRKICEYTKIDVNDKYYVESDRSKAIKFAISKMQENDLLLIAGKGDETYQIINDKKNYFSDHNEVLKYFNIL